MSPIRFKDKTATQRLLLASNPLFGLMSGKFYEDQPHPSAMLTERNWLYRLTLSSFINRVEVDQNTLARLKELSDNNTIVYVAKNLSQLEYHYFNQLFKENALPLACFTNAFAWRRWMKWSDFWASLKNEEAYITAHHKIQDPTTDGSLKKWILEGRSVLLSIPHYDLIDEDTFFSEPLLNLFTIIAAQKESDRPILLVPLELLFRLRPQKEKRTISDILFGESELPGRFKKTLLFWRNLRRNAHATIGNPINLKELVQSPVARSDRELISVIKKDLLNEITIQKKTLIGPTIKPKSWFVHEVMGDEVLDEKICRLAAERTKPADDLRNLAMKYAREIAADIDYTYIEVLERILGRVFKDLFESFDVDTEGIKKVKELYSKGPVIFAPNHKSHADYLLLSYILHAHGMCVPHIAAGINLEFWPLGAIFRHCGAYFIRRAFRDNLLYRIVLETYLKVLLKQGYPQEFFIEGGRSRTGKLLKPRKGMLTMLHNAAKEGGVSNITFVPVAITYDRVIEQKSYMDELDGGSKEKEKTSHLLRLTKYLKRQRHRYGSIYVRFGAPIPMQEGPCNSSDIENLARKICHEINRKLVVTPGGVAAAALLAPARRGVPDTEIVRNWEMLSEYLRTKKIDISAKIKSPHGNILEDALGRLEHTKLISSHKDFIESFHSIDEDKRAALSFTKNSIVHFLATVGFTASIIKKRAAVGADITENDIVKHLSVCQVLFSHEFRFATRKALPEHTRDALNFLSSKNIIQYSTGSIRPAYEFLWAIDLFAAQVRPFIETIWVAFLYVTMRLNGSKDEKLATQEMIKTAKDLYLLGRIQYRESITKVGFENALKILADYGIVSLEFSGPSPKKRKLYSTTGNNDAIATLKVELETLL